MSDIYHPHWRATLNGEPVPILVGNYALRAILLEPGTHLVEMVFAPPAWRWGVIVTAITALLLLAGLILWLRWRRREERAVA